MSTSHSIRSVLIQEIERRKGLMKYHEKMMDIYQNWNLEGEKEAAFANVMWNSHHRDHHQHWDKVNELKRGLDALPEPRTRRYKPY